MANAQQSTRAYRIALVSPAIPTSAFGGDPLYRAFFEALGRLGYDEGRNLAVARHSGGGIVEHYAELAQEVVRAKPDVIVTATSRMVRIFKAATSTIHRRSHGRSGRLWGRRELGPTGRKLYRSCCR
jgi:putative tryptophan/tyrosine transport system substrate-binding protein